ncbi:hypothetical protein QAD02_012506 [Eretmocerus hayati]|uniref:Uncharacterized protein n=1 Tax=Eretmocerus hayati TaxID=131215 RepID=A0ACC2NZM7_9HYME|nr:hypothetical protein QAD02_012506 [Eretmocerus hayati]
MVKSMSSVSDKSGKMRQLFAALIVNGLSLAYGLVCGWGSPMVPLLQRGQVSGWEGPVPDEQAASWIGGLFCLGGLAVAPLLGWMLERLGRKGFGYATCCPMMLSWLLTGWPWRSLGWLYAARALGGVSGAMGMFFVPVYVSEIASEANRGALGSLLLFGINIGVLVAFVAGSVLSYGAFALLGVAVVLVFVVGFYFLPETPVYLVRQGRTVEATKSLIYFTGNNKTLVNEKLSDLQAQIHSREGENPARNPSLCDLFKDRATRRGMIIVLGLLGGQQFCGIFAMINYAETIFRASGSSMSPQTSATMLATIQVLGSYVSTTLMERAGRRMLVLFSCFGMCLCHLSVGVFCMLQASGWDVSAVSWLPPLALSTYMAVYCLGMGPAPFVVASEVFRVELSSAANTCCFVFLWAMAFVVVKSFGSMIELMGIGGCFLMLSAFCASSFVFALAMLPETKGRKREDIVEELALGGRGSTRKPVARTYFDREMQEADGDKDKCSTETAR